jgi:thiamine biosynthesis lipoprotein
VLLPEAEAVLLPPQVGLDFGGVAKGYAADLVVGELLEARARGACVNVGGDAAVAGEAPTPDGWLVEIAPASRASGEPRHVALQYGAICTSTITKRTWATSRGQQHHLIDPRASRPATTEIASVTVLAARAVAAEVATKDALLGSIGLFAAWPNNSADTSREALALLRGCWRSALC